MTTLSEKPPSVIDTGARLRVVLMLDIYDGARERFLEVYEQLRHKVAAVPGHISDQLCQSIEDPSKWLLTSEWESARPFLEWVDSPAHIEMVKPMHGCVRDTRSLRYRIMRETSGLAYTDTPAAPADSPVSPVSPIPAAAGGPPRAAAVGGPAGPAVRPGPDGVIRHALTFTVKPGSEPAVARLLAGYSSPKTQVDEHTRLLRTSLFMLGNRVVRAVEISGDLGAALRHIAAQPEVRAVEEAINPHLEEARDLDDPQSARGFFARAALPAVHHRPADGPVPADVRRHALVYPLLPGNGPAAARLLADQDQDQDQQPADGRIGPVVASTVFQRDDLLVRLVDLRTPLDEDPAATLGITEPHRADELARLVDLGAGGDLTTGEGQRRFLQRCVADLITDRRSAER